MIDAPADQSNGGALGKNVRRPTSQCLGEGGQDQASLATSAGNCSPQPLRFHCRPRGGGLQFPGCTAGRGRSLIGGGAASAAGGLAESGVI